MEVSLNYGSKRVVENLNLRVNTGSRIRIRGANGAGKTTLIQAILGEDKVSTELNLSAGTIKLNRDLVISYVPQDTSWVYGSIGDFSKSSNLDQGLYMSMLRKLGFRKEELSRDLSELSEGLKKKVLLARSMLEPAHLYIWDEPLNYIDIYTRMQIEDAIMRSEPTMLYIEHDEVFSARVMTEELLIS
jgi:lincosamide and streptogramin A transport system ATP-binding/permease protein